VKGRPPATATHVFLLLGTAAFVAVFLGHLLYLGYLTGAAQKDWADNFDPSVSFWQSYVINQDYFVSFSYALSASFAVWATARFVYSRRRAAAIGAVGGVSLLTFMATAGCFLIGCCGSPMLAVYLSLFGAKALGLGKPLMALVTLVSVSCGYWCLSRRLSRGSTYMDCCPRSDTSTRVEDINRFKVKIRSQKG
jgi:hypothetical protein